MNDITFISFYTKKTPYEQIIQDYLLKSLEMFPQLKYKIYPVEPLGKWVKNVNLKPKIIQQALEELNTDIVILDADARILQMPELLYNINCDIACHILDWDYWYQNNTHVKELLTGTLYLKNNEIIKELVKDWIYETTKNYTWEQKQLEKLLKTKYRELNLYNLPIEYCTINTLPNGEKPYVNIENPVIMHYQKSRDLKNKLL